MVGASGSGKSTMLHILGALDKPDKGVVRYEGQDLGQQNGRGLNKYRNQTVGFVFQFYHLLDELNVLENVFLPTMTGMTILGWLACRNHAKKRAMELLDRLGLGDRVRHKPYQLSGGERQRVAIARALANDPEVILADEPTGNLDTKTGEGVIKLFEELNKEGKTIIMVTHDMDMAKHANKVYKLKDGRIVK